MKKVVMSFSSCWGARAENARNLLRGLRKVLAGFSPLRRARAENERRVLRGLRKVLAGFSPLRRVRTESERRVLRGFQSELKLASTLMGVARGFRKVLAGFSPLRRVRTENERRVLRGFRSELLRSREANIASTLMGVARGFRKVLAGFSPLRRVRTENERRVLRGFRSELKLWTTLGCALLATLLPAAPRELDVVLVVGAAGTEEYGKKFNAQAEAWTNACKKAGLSPALVRGEKTAEELQRRLAAADPTRSLWLVLIGHGTFDGREAMFSAEGPDFDVKQLAGWLQPLKQEVAVIHTASASGGFLKSLSGKNRVVITSTKSPDEVFYARFGEYFAEAIGGLPEADLDQDKQVSLLEAFRHASKAVATYYENEGRLATEHALLEDNGDGIGTRSEVFAVDAPPATGAPVDGARAAQLVLVLSEEEQLLSDEQRRTRDALERELKTLKEQRAQMPEDDYYAKLEALLRKLGEVYERKS